MDLSTNFMGLELESPFVPSATPLSKNLDSARKLEDAGASALIMHSLFQEQIEGNYAADHSNIGGGHLYEHSNSLTAPQEYLEQFQRLNTALGIPVIPSLNATSAGEWATYAEQLESAGAPALELNIYYVAANIEEAATSVEQRILDVFRAAHSRVNLPICVKLSPYFSSLGFMVKSLEKEGASAVSLFNTFYQPNIDLETLAVSDSLDLSSTGDALLAMRWIAILSGRTEISLAASGGIQFAEDALKMLLCGADITCLGSTLLLNGPGHLTRVRDNTIHWLTEKGYESLAQFRGLMSQKRVEDPSVFVRSHYMKMLTEFKS